MGSLGSDEKTCYVTLVTKDSYIPGVVILSHTLDKHGSRYPFLVQYTESLGDQGIKILKNEAERAGRIVPVKVDLLLPRAGMENKGSVAERFKDTFTKLRAFEVYKNGFTRACFLDADMAAFQNPDTIFDTKIPRDWIACNHSCVCNLDHDSWAPDAWQKGNCAYTTLTRPDQVANDTSSRPTYGLLNGGLFMFYPSEELWTQMMGFFNYTERLKEYQFPDQDFFADFFRNKWQPVSWKYNAIKTMRYWHPQIWSDDVLVILHYIVDKPWERQVSSEGVAGHLGRDGTTHRWWWNIYNDWLEKQKEDNQTLVMMRKLINTQKPFTEVVPLPQEPGRPEDIKPYEEMLSWSQANQNGAHKQ